MMQKSKEKDELSKREALVQRLGEAKVNILFPLLADEQDEHGEPVIYKLLGDANNGGDVGGIELRFEGVSSPIRGSKDRVIEGSIPDFEPSVLKVLLKAIGESESEEDRAHPNQYFNGIEYVDYPAGLSDFEKAMLRTRFVKQLFTDVKRGNHNGDSRVTDLPRETVALSALYVDIDKRLKVIETNGSTRKPREIFLPIDMMRLGDMVNMHKQYKEKKQKGKTKEVKKDLEPLGQQGLTNAISEEDKHKGLTLEDMKLRDFVQK